MKPFLVCYVKMFLEEVNILIVFLRKVLLTHVDRYDPICWVPRGAKIQRRGHLSASWAEKQTFSHPQHENSLSGTHITLFYSPSKFQAFNQELRMVPSSPDPIPFACWLSYTISFIGPPMFRPVPECSNVRPQKGSPTFPRACLWEFQNPKPGSQFS